MFFTAATTSLATKATMSAQETTPGHAFSSADLTLSIIWNPRRLRFGTASFSACFVEEFKSTEPSQPYIDKAICVRKEKENSTKQIRDIQLHTLTKQSWKCILSKGPASEGATDIVWVITFLTMNSASGHVFA